MDKEEYIKAPYFVWMANRNMEWEKFPEKRKESENLSQLR